ncbi:MAG: helix-turn-helix transcriptional regulator [Actinomycetales bacterium]|nr:helix-turn-helix transcriptional regulator [Actinomycetales bacterium]
MSPVFAHGQLRLYLLALLAEGPRHGYDIIQDLEARFGGLYTPSAGTVYPRLAKLEEEGLVERSDEGRKSTYRITEAGRAEVAGRTAEIEGLQADLDASVRHLADEVRENVHGRSADLRAELKAAARAARTTARPAGGASTQARGSWPWSDDTAAGMPPATPWAARSAGRGSAGPGAGATDWAELERAAADLRAQARDLWQTHGLTPSQTREIREILTEASRRIGEVLRSARG